MMIHISNTFLRLFSLISCYIATDEFVDFDEEELMSPIVSNDTKNQQNCSIPKLDLFSQDVMKVYSKAPDLFCNIIANSSNITKPSLFLEDSRFLYFNASALRFYGSTDIYCFYTSFERIDGANDDVRYNPEKVLSLNEPNEIVDEFIRVTCKDRKTNSIIYEEYFAFVPLKETTEKRCDNVTKEPSLNILVIGLDTLSRLQFHRHFPRSSAILKTRLEAIELLGYNAVGENTFPNLVPLLTGLSENQLENLCLKNNQGLADTCPFIWKKYHQKGFRTIFVEDASYLTLFNFCAKGFIHQPTDYYLRPMYIEYERNLGHDNIGCGYRCLGLQSNQAFLLNHAEKTARVFRDKKYFGFYWSCSATHDNFNIPAQVDETMEKFLETLIRDNLLNNTLLIVMSDHGPRMRNGKFYYTMQGQCEKRLPLLTLVFPDWFKRRYATAFENVRQNSHTLTTNFDLHLTFHDLMNLNLLENEILMKRQWKNKKFKQGRSLFLPISTNRSCHEAGIPPEYCACDCNNFPVPVATT